MNLCGRKVGWNIILDVLIFVLGIFSDADWIRASTFNLVVYIISLVVILTFTVMKHMKGR